MGNIKPSNIPNRLRNVSKEHPYVAGAVDIIDDELNRNQQNINADTYRKDETYSKEQLNNLITTPEQEYVTVVADDQTTAATDVLPPTGEADTVYRVGNWDGEQYDPTVYSEYAWDGTDYVFLDKKEYTLATAEDFIEPDADKRAKIPTVGALADVFGSYASDNDISILTDKNNRILLRIEKDGNIYFGRIPIQIVEEIDGKVVVKVDKEEGKSLIPVQYIQEFDDIYLALQKDKNGRVLSRINNDGTIEIAKLDALSLGDGIKILIQGMIPIVPSSMDISNGSPAVVNELLNLNGDVSYISEDNGADSFVVDGDTVYFAPYSRPRVFAADWSEGTSPSLIRMSGVSLPSGVKDLAGRGEYLFVCGRDNGSGLDGDVQYPEYYFPFEGNSLKGGENIQGFDSYIHSEEEGKAGIEIVNIPAPCRFQNSARLYTGDGTESAMFVKSASFGTGGISLWISKVTEVLSGTVYIPLLRDNDSNVLSVAVDSSNRIGLRVNNTDTFSNTVLDSEWVNVKIVIESNKVSMYLRSKECKALWGDAILSSNVSNLTADSLCLGIESEADNVELLVDDLAFDSGDIDEKVAVNGYLSIVRKSDLSIVKTFKTNLRCLSLLIDGERLYMGMIGGINVYDISDLLNPVLIGFNRESPTYWRYPKSQSSIYQYQVYGSESQRMCFMADESKSYIVAGCDANGINIYDITDVEDISLVASVRDIPLVRARVIATGNEYDSPQYVEWGVYAEYPFIYSTVASLHSLHNGVNELVNPERDTVYGMKVRDISDINDIKTKVIPIPSEWYNTFAKEDGDARPSSLCKHGNQIIMGNANKGILVFSVKGLQSEFLYGKEMPHKGRMDRICSTSDGKVFAGDSHHTLSESSCYIYLLS